MNSSRQIPFPKWRTGLLCDAILLLAASLASAQLQWIQRFPASIPPARSHHAAVYDSARCVTVLFGGTADYSAGFSDTWVFDGINWEEKLPGKSPSPRYEHAMAYDAARRVTILFGGLDPSHNPLAD